MPSAIATTPPCEPHNSLLYSRLDGFAAVTVCAALWACLNGAALAAPPTDTVAQSAGAPAEVDRAPTWSSLSSGQQSALRPLERAWRSIGPEHKQKWMDLAAQFPAMSPDEQRRVQTRMTEWSTRTPEQRGAARLQFKQAQQLAPSNRQARWEAYQALPEAEKKEFAARAVPGSTAAPSLAAQRRARSAEALNPSEQGVQQKSNVIAAPEIGRPLRSVAPTVVQAPTGATTTLVSKRPAPPVHQQAGLPKITASPTFVNPSTLLPQRGPQGAAVVSAGGSASAPGARR